MRHVKMKRKRRLLAAAGGLLAVSGPAQAALDPSDILAYSAGPVVIRPHLRLAEQYSDNIYYSRPVKSDFITILQPGLEGELGRPDSQVHATLNYRLTSLNYAGSGRNNALDHNVTLQSRIVRGLLAPNTPRLVLEGNDTLQFASSIYGGQAGFVQGGAAQAGKVDRQSYQLEHELGYNLSEKTGVYGRASYDATDFEKGSYFLDVGRLRGTAGFQYKGLSRTWFFGEAYYGQSSAHPNLPIPKGPYAESVGGFLGARGAFTAKLSGSVKAGYESVAYGDGSEGVGSPVAEASLGWQPAERTSALLSYSRHTRLSVQTTKTLMTTDMVNAEVHQTLGTAARAAVTVGSSLGFSDYGASSYWKDRTDTFFRAHLEFSYRLRLWLTAAAGYEFEMLSSSDKRLIDYQVNRVTLSVNVGY